MLVLTDLNTLPLNIKNMYEAAGVVLKNGMTDPAMVKYANNMTADADGDSNEGQLKAIHMVKLAPMWDTDYAAVVTIDTDLMLGTTGEEQQIDLLNMLLDPNGPAVLYRHGTLSPLNAGFFGFRPDRNFHDVFVTAVDNGYSETDGWGAQHYSEPLLKKFKTWSEAFMKGTHSLCKDQHRATPWCWIGGDQDQGMLAHMIAASGPDGTPYISSSDLRGDAMDGSEESESADTHHYTGHTKPWSVSGLEAESNHGKVSGSTHQAVTHFWSHYSTLYRQSWKVAPESVKTSCPAFYSCLFNEIKKLDHHVMDGVKDLNNATEANVAASEFVDAAEAASCSH
jgi:hypothetical protein